MMSEVLSSFSSSTVTETSFLVFNLNYFTPEERNQGGENNKVYMSSFWWGDKLRPRQLSSLPDLLLHWYSLLRFSAWEE